MRSLALLASAAAGIAFPRTCAGCDGTARPLLCEGCAHRAVAASPRALAGIERCASAFEHEGAPRAALLAAKLGGERRGVADLARWLPEIATDAVTWVPDTYAARASRGGSITASFARAYAGRLEIPVAGLLRRDHARGDLGGASRAARFEAIRGAFRPRRAAPASVVLVDDVVTTGATAMACARALRAGGAERVSLVTFTSAR